MRARVSLSAVGTGEIEVDGQRLENAVRGLTIAARAGKLTELTLDVVVLDGVDVEGEAHVTIPDPTRDALIALGWTPPEV